MQSLFSQHRRSFEREHGAALSPHQWLALRKITACRTPVLGGKVHACAECGCEHELYHSCNHRLCPQCGAQAAHEWCEKQSAKLLPNVDYFMLTPTLPGSLRAHSRRDERRWYDWFFAATSSAIMELMAADKDLGGQAGFFGVLQTWKRDLDYHPHIHYVVPGGVLIEEWRKVPGQRKHQRHRRWKHTRSGPSGPYLLNAYALQKAVRMRMEQLVRDEAPELYAIIPRSVWREAWRIDFRHVGSGKEVIRYLARYVTKSAISNAQLISGDAQRITYAYTPGGTQRSVRKTLEAHEFMSRVLQHALPTGFKRIRYFGWLHPSAKNRLEHVKLLLGKPLIYEQKTEPPPEITRKPTQRCRQCQGQQLRPVRDIPPLKPKQREAWERRTFGPPYAESGSASGSSKQHGSRAPPTATPES